MLHTNNETGCDLSQPQTNNTSTRGPRLTRNQNMVFDMLKDLGRSAGAYELLDLLRPQGVNAIPTIYRALSELEQKGLVRHLASTKSFVALTEGFEKDQQKVMLVCDQCRSVTPIHDAGTISALTDNAKGAGFTVHSRHLELVGICPKCSSQ